jgi:hypothetical protein
VQIDFHYCTIRILAEKAGFSPEDAQIIAYASQYVDDAVDHQKMQVTGQIDIFSRRFTENTFDPVCTAHRGLQLIKSFKDDVQKKIFIPFHFLPGTENAENLIVKKDSVFARKLVGRALTELAKASGEMRILNLIRLGITLHTYADTWTHQDFSGIHSSKDNDVKTIEIYKSGKWEKIPVLLKLEYDSLPDIGHAEVGPYPDISHLKWRFVKASGNTVYERDNTQLMMEASELIFNLLQGIGGTENWEGIQFRFQECFSFESSNIEEKYIKFQKTFPEIGFYYQENQWKDEAIRLIERTKLMQVMEQTPRYVLGSDKKWFYFHLAAYEQRTFVTSILESSGYNNKRKLSE